MLGNVALWCRVRKRFNVLNVGTGVLELGMETRPPWSVLAGAGAGAREKEGECGCDARIAPRLPVALLRLQPRSSVEVLTPIFLLHRKKAIHLKSPISIVILYLVPPLQAFSCSISC